MTVRDLADEWIDYSSADLASARFLLAMKPMPAEIICFHCQQSAEKSLKALLALWDRSIPRTHALVQLLGLIVPDAPSTKALESDAESLTEYGSDIRYPSKKPLSESDAREAIAAAERVLAAVRSILV
jgi:HEPN domain-containing protein